MLTRSVGVLGFGSQGEAQALNLRDSGIDVIVGLRDGSHSKEKCKSFGIGVGSFEQVVTQVDTVVMLVADEAQAEVYQRIEPHLREHTALVFAHGFAIHYQAIVPRKDLDVVLVAPFAIGRQLRLSFSAGQSVPIAIAIEQDASGQAREKAQAYAASLGFKDTVFETTFSEETEIDLFAEQAVLCGGVNHLITAAYQTLVDAGYQEELAYLSCLHELKFLVDMLHDQGIARTRSAISNTAEYGDYLCGAEIIGDAAKQAMGQALARVRSGEFAKEIAHPEFKGRLVAMRQKALQASMEQVGERLRARFVKPLQID